MIDLDWSDRFNFGGPRPLSQVFGVCVHTTESPLGTPAENVARYQLGKRNSYHVLTDSRGIALRENTDDWTAWAAGSPANETMLHVSMVCYAATSRAQWLSPAYAPMLDKTARVVAAWCKAQSITPTWGTPADLNARRRKIYGHADVTAAWWGSHTDPGANFPRVEFAARVASLMRGATPPRKDDELTPEQARQLAYIAAQLGPWSQLGKNSRGQDLTLVDAVADSRARQAQIEANQRAILDRITALEARR